MKRTGIFSAVVCVVIAGCQPASSNSTSSAPAAPPPSSPDPVSTPATRIGGLELNTTDGVAAKSSAAPASSPAPAPDQASAPAATEQVKAQTGVGVKGKSLEQHSGVIVEPVKQLLRFEQKAVFDIQIPQAMSLFQATEGRKPNSHDEFMTRIISANNIALPKLPAGHRYLYDPEKGELMVERPAQ